MAPPLPVQFLGAGAGPWRIERAFAVAGEPLPPAPCLSVIEARARPDLPDVRFTLRGSTGHVRYVDAREKAALGPVSPGLGRPEATRAALIPIRKSDAWWELAQDERRAILEQRSRHITVGLEYLPAIARRLFHARELGEPFDFLTWFEFAPEHEARFDELLVRLRASEEWRYVEREVELRLSRDSERV
jgi:Chlorite dismutase